MLRCARVGRLVGSGGLRWATSAKSNFTDGFWDPKAISGSKPLQLKNLVDGKWSVPKHSVDVVDPLNGEVFIKMPDTRADELQPFIDSLAKVSKSGLHNPLKKPDRYLHYGQVSAKAAEALGDPEIEDTFVRAIQRVMPKSYAQALAEVRVTRIFLQNNSGDSVRQLARGFTLPGDHPGQQSTGYRWPYGAVCIISPFNFPLEIPALQLMGALYMGNKPVLKAAPLVSMVAELFVRLLINCGMDPTDVDLLHCDGPVVQKLITTSNIRLTQFTGSQRVAELLSRETHGKVKIEDAGFDWKVLGPDASKEYLEYVAWQCDQDAYANAGQKCSAQSILFVHENWQKLGLYDRLKHYASSRKLDDLTNGPVLTHTTESILEHTKKLLTIPGAKILFGGKELSGHKIPKQFGAVEPTAVFVPLKELIKEKNYELCTKEIFGPFQVVSEYNDAQLDDVLKALEDMSHHLTAAVVSNDRIFTQKVLAHTVNGTSYAGIRARTTGAPQNHWFGPAGDPRGAGIGTIEAIRLVWSCHREVIVDEGPVSSNWKPQTS